MRSFVMWEGERFTLPLVVCLGVRSLGILRSFVIAHREARSIRTLKPCGTLGVHLPDDGRSATFTLALHDAHPLEDGAVEDAGHDGKLGLAEGHAIERQLARQLGDGASNETGHCASPWVECRVSGIA